MSQRGVTCFLALEPDEAFAAVVRAYKERTRQLAGPQQFLDDPPHLTLYLAVFADAAVVAVEAAASAGKLRVPIVDMQGWHVFSRDALTGNNTLVCRIADACRPALALVQERVVEAVAGLRDPEATRARYAAAWFRLSAPEQHHVERRGFPFLGSIWHPHVTIASIRSGAWESVWRHLAGAPPCGRVRFPTLKLYALNEEHPQLLGQFPLETSP